MAMQFVPLGEWADNVGPDAPPRQDECAGIEAEELSVWIQDDFDLDASLAAKLGFGIGGGSIGGTQRLLIREFSRSSICVGADGKRYRYGTAVRLVVRINGLTAAANLSIPFVAAETQLARMQAESTLRVIGYVGEKLAELLPPFRAFNVDTYAELSTRMNEVKRLIGEDVKNVRPVKLGVEISSEERLDVAFSLGLVWGLTCISKGRSCEEGKRSYPDSASISSMRAIEQAYGSMPNPSPGTRDRPTKVHEQTAKEMLRGLKLE